MNRAMSGNPRHRTAATARAGYAAALMHPITRLMRLIVIITVLAMAGQSARAAGLLPELDASSPAATLRSLRAEAERIEALYNTYQAMPTTATELAMAHGMQRIGTQLLDLHEIAPATRLKSGAAAAGYLADILARLPEIPPESIRVIPVGPALTCRRTGQSPAPRSASSGWPMDPVLATTSSPRIP